MLKRFVHANQADWDDCLPAALWAYRVATKTATHASPFEMVYGTQPLLPTEYIVPTFQTLQPRDYTPHRVLAARIGDLHHLEEIRALATTHILHKQSLAARHFQGTQPPRVFQKGDQVLWCPRDPKLKRSKFESIWHGPYRVQLALPNNTVLLVNDTNYDPHATIVNSAKLKQYHTTTPQITTALSLQDIHTTLAAEARDADENITDKATKEDQSKEAVGTQSETTSNEGIRQSQAKPRGDKHEKTGAKPEEETPTQDNGRQTQGNEGTPSEGHTSSPWDLAAQGTSPTSTIPMHFPCAYINHIHVIHGQNPGSHGHHHGPKE